MSTSGAAVGVGWGWHLGSTFPFSSLSYLKCSSWLRTVGRKKRDLKRERSHTTVNSEAKEENTAGGKGQKAEPACLPAFTGIRNREIFLGNAAWTSPCANVEGSGLGVGRPVTLRLVLRDPGPVPSPFQSSTVPARK